MASASRGETVRPPMTAIGEAEVIKDAGLR